MFEQLKKKERTGFRYKAFISYKNDSKNSKYNQKHAADLYKAIRKYEKHLFKPCPIELFLDKHEMQVGEDLSSRIKEALRNSEYLIYLASKEAAESEWVEEEIRIWCEDLKRVNNLIIVFIDGEIEIKSKKINWKTTNALPSILKKYLKSEPLYVDLKWARNDNERNLKNTQYNTIVNNISARLHEMVPIERAGKKYSESRREIRIRNIAIVLLTILLIMVLFAFLYASNQKKRAVNLLICALVYCSSALFF